MSKMEDIRRRSNSPLLAVEGRIVKSGEGWVYIEEEAESYTTTVRVKNADGDEEKETIEILPYRLMICYQKSGSARYERKFKDNEGKTLVFTVNAKADINRKNKSLEVRYWLVNVYTPDEYIDQLEILDRARKAMSDKSTKSRR